MKGYRMHISQEDASVDDKGFHIIDSNFCHPLFLRMIEIGGENQRVQFKFLRPPEKRFSPLEINWLKNILLEITRSFPDYVLDDASDLTISGHPDLELVIRHANPKSLYTFRTIVRQTRQMLEPIFARCCTIQKPDFKDTNQDIYKPESTNPYQPPEH